MDVVVDANVTVDLVAGDVSLLIFNDLVERKAPIYISRERLVLNSFIIIN